MSVSFQRAALAPSEASKPTTALDPQAAKSTAPSSGDKAAAADRFVTSYLSIPRGQFHNYTLTNTGDIALRAPQYRALGYVLPARCFNPLMVERVTQLLLAHIANLPGERLVRDADLLTLQYAQHVDQQTDSAITTFGRYSSINTAVEQRGLYAAINDAKTKVQLERARAETAAAAAAAKIVAPVPVKAEKTVEGTSLADTLPVESPPAAHGTPSPTAALSAPQADAAEAASSEV